MNDTEPKEPPFQGDNGFEEEIIIVIREGKIIKFSTNRVPKSLENCGASEKG